MTDRSSDAAPGKPSVLTRLLRPFTAAVQALRENAVQAALFFSPRSAGIFAAWG